jgi:putative NADH-flavin reductase
MKLVVLGAGGEMGGRLVTEALERGHEVTAVSSRPARDEASRVRLRNLTADVRDSAAVESALAGREAVLWAPGDIRVPGETELSDDAVSVTAAMERHGPRRLVFLSPLSLANAHRRGMLFSAVFMTWLFRRPELRDAETQERHVRDSALDWTIMRAGTLFDGPRRPSYRLTLGDADVPPDPHISYADAADYMLRQLTDATYVRATVGVFY